MIYSHQDQVETLPTAAQKILGEEFCPNAAFKIAEHILGFQGHPEFDAVYTKRLLSRRKFDIGEHRFDQAMASMDEETDAYSLGLKLIDWMLGADLDLND